jgi:chloramphenicol-sensitive protein RarD
VGNWFFFIYVMNHISIKAASFAYLVCPILTTLLAFFILKEQLNKWQWTAVALSVISCVLLSYNNSADIMYSLIVAITYALYLISQRKNTGFDKFLVLSIQLVFAGLILLPFYPMHGTNMGDNYIFYLQILLIAVVFTIVPLYLNLFSLQGVKSSTMGILLYLNPLINFAIALLYYHEAINTLQVVAYLIIALSIVIFNKNLIFKPKN